MGLFEAFEIFAASYEKIGEDDILNYVCVVFAVCGYLKFIPKVFFRDTMSEIIGVGTSVFTYHSYTHLEKNIIAHETDNIMIYLSSVVVYLFFQPASDAIKNNINEHSIVWFVLILFYIILIIVPACIYGLYISITAGALYAYMYILDEITLSNSVSNLTYIVLLLVEVGLLLFLEPIAKFLITKLFYWLSFVCPPFMAVSDILEDFQFREELDDL